MKTHLIAHTITSPDGSQPPRVQALAEHSRNTARLCAAICRPLGLEKLGALTGWLHDMGKAAQPVQDTSGSRPGKGSATPPPVCGGSGSRPPDRATPSGWPGRWPPWPLAATTAAAATICRPTAAGPGWSGWTPGRPRPSTARAWTPSSPTAAPGREMESLIQAAALEVAALYKRSKTILPKGEDRQQRQDALQFGLGLAQRFLFSALVDADWTDTASFMGRTPLPPFPSDRQRQATWDLLSGRMERFIRSMEARRPIDLLRQEISGQCLAAAEHLPAGIYRLCVPTGGWQDLFRPAVLRGDGRRQNARRLFYFAPYKSITRQNADNIRRALGAEYVLEHHSDVLFEPDQQDQRERWLALSQRWQGSPVICTTMVQLLDALFAAPRQNVRRLAALPVRCSCWTRSRPAPAAYLPAHPGPEHPAPSVRLYCPPVHRHPARPDPGPLSPSVLPRQRPGARLSGPVPAVQADQGHPPAVQGEAAPPCHCGLCGRSAEGKPEHSGGPQHQGDGQPAL